MIKGHLPIPLEQWQEMRTAVIARYRKAHPQVPLFLNTSPNSHAGLADDIQEVTGERIVSARWLSDWFNKVVKERVGSKTSAVHWHCLLRYTKSGTEDRPEATAPEPSTDRWHLEGAYTLYYHSSTARAEDPVKVDEARLSFADGKMTLYEPETRIEYRQSNLIKVDHLQHVTLQQEQSRELLYFMIECGEYHRETEYLGGMMIFRDKHGRPRSGPVLLCRLGLQLTTKQLENFFATFTQPVPKLPTHDDITKLLNRQPTQREIRLTGFYGRWVVVYYSHDRSRYEVSVLTISPNGATHESATNTYNKGTAEIVTASCLLVTLTSSTRYISLIAAIGPQMRTNTIMRMSVAWCGTGDALPNHGYAFLFRESGLGQTYPIGRVTNDQMLSIGLTQLQIDQLKDYWQMPIPEINRF